ncbi:MAG: undecaprenyldiphospho-muramoylpentapeptide beta-N-acetylglucosaminyltransferase [Acidobacteria bacterium]|nr:MAG: undecaprenyldiphospho-muramoylpentapeptide beta-N-acetylglucosaminyltransferase [Acidobacteriota bacterium]
MPAERPIVIAGGGTGGHVFPGLAVAEELRRRRPSGRLLWIGARGGLEERLVPRHAIPLTLLPLAGAAHLGLRRGLRAAWLAGWATARLWLRFLRERPALLIGVGGFASGPALLAGALLGVPTLILEQNAVPGRTNRLLSTVAAAAAVSFPSSARQLRCPCVATGNPVRREIAAAPPRAAGPLRRLLAAGGSRGARALNEAWERALPRLARLPLSVELQTGPDDAERLRRAAREAEAAPGARLEVEVAEFFDDIPRRLASADLFVGRAGATTVAELTAAGRASLLVPYPHAADDHQRANARALAAAGAALVIDPDELTPERLAAAIEALAADPARLQRMSDAARRLGRRDAAARVADLAEKLALRPAREAA